MNDAMGSVIGSSSAAVRAASSLSLQFTYDASGENAFAIRLDFDRREDAEEFGKHFNGASY